MAEVIQYTIGMSNGFFIREGETVLAVDGGGEMNGPAFERACRENGFEPKDIRLIILTHGHVDHFVNLGIVKELTGAPLLCHEKAARSLREGLPPFGFGRNRLGKEIMRAQAINGDPITVIPKVEPDMTFEGEYDLSEWGVGGKIIETPGHSACSTAIILDSGQAIVGDTVAQPPEADKVTLAFITDIENGNEVLYASIDAILREASIIYSGHGGPFTPEEVMDALERDKREFGK